MNEIDRQLTIKRYSERLKKFGTSDEALGWTRNNNKTRFEVLTKEWQNELDNSTILDYGCGFADYYGFLLTMNILPSKYFGLDINSDLLAIAKERYNEIEVLVGDVDSLKGIENVDFSFISGVFNHKLENQNEKEFIKDTIEKVFSKCDKGLAVNFLSDKVEYQTEHNHNSNPGEILEFCFSLTNNIVLRNDYMPFEFTVFLRKNIPLNREKLIFERQ